MADPRNADLDGLLRVEQPKRTLTDLVVSPRIRAQIDNALAMFKYRQILGEEWGFDESDSGASALTINLYGPPGTGKTLCAHAISGSLGRPLLNVNYAALESKYVGDTSKNILEAFRRARAASAVLFFDEADSVLRKRFAQVTQSTEHVVNVTRSVLLVELERFNGIVVFATNLIEGCDPAFFRRMVAHVEFELPDLSCRRSLWEGLIPSKVPRDSNVTAQWLATESDGLSGGELQKLTWRAACRAVQRSKEERRLTRDDFLAEFGLLRTSKVSVLGLGLAATSANAE
ncbi:MAG: AAA family ATPase [Polyangiaceae bacterium]